MRSRLGLLALLSVGCHYEWVPDYLVPEICPSEKPTAAALRPRPVLALEAGAIRGRVMGHADSAYPIAGSLAILSGTPPRRGFTDRDGYFRLDSISGGTYYLIIRSVGYRPWHDTVEVTPGPASKFEVRLQPDMYDGPCSGFELARIKRRRIGR